MISEGTLHKITLRVNKKLQLFG